MADGTTTNYNFTLPEIGGSDDSWGDKLNQNWRDVDSDLKGIADQLAGLAVGSGNIPIGGILMYNGTVGSIPANYKICDGTNGTPDLRDRFIVGSSPTKLVGSTGGSATITEVPEHLHAAGTIVAASAGAHIHPVTDPGHLHSYSDIGGNSGTGVGENYTGGADFQLRTFTKNTGSKTTGIAVASAGAHLHTTSGSTAKTGVTGGVPLLPLYYALMYIRRMS